MLQLDRQMVLKVLFNHIRDHSKLLTRKRVVTIELTESEAKVTTADGSTYSGAVVVGADGIHSKVRKEMQCLATRTDRESDLLDEQCKEGYPLLCW